MMRPRGAGGTRNCVPEGDFVPDKFFSGAENIFSGTMFELRKAIFHEGVVLLKSAGGEAGF
jgi:hypothetical protein